MGIKKPNPDENHQPPFVYIVLLNVESKLNEINQCASVGLRVCFPSPRASPLSFQSLPMLSMCTCLCVFVFVPLFQCCCVGIYGGVCVGASAPCVFQPSGVHPLACLFVFSVFALASLMLSSYSLAATGQLINQIFKQCFSAQWVVLDYLWLLAVHGAATL